MKILTCKGETEWVEAINDWLRDRLRSTNSQRLFVPAGETPRPLYENWQKKGAPFSRALKLVQIDEALTGFELGVFRRFFEAQLPSYQNQFEYIEEAERGGDLAILGLGLNGHVAFHEPGFPKGFYSGCLSLNRETVEKLKWSPHTRVVSYGVGAFLKSKAILLIVRGESKRSILNEILKAGCDRPAAWLKNHSDFTVITDFEL
jgi:6-phosphogluconolactonase/glucosamine-6-phosphate isomerase/deaminase